MIHLHTHSMYSLRDSIIKPEEIVKRLHEIKQNAIAITDHGTSLGGVSIYKLLKDNGIKYIHGCEFYICDNVQIKDKDNKYFHLVALCKNETGRQNINKLISISGKAENKYSKPRIDFELLSTYGEGLIILSACLAGEISRHIMNGEIVKAEETAKKYKDRFGEDYFLEVQARNDKVQIQTNKQIRQISNKLSIECVVTTDAHHTYKEDRKYQIKYSFNGAYKEDGESYVGCYIQTENEIRENLDYFDDEFIEKVINNTHVISDKCNVEMPLSAPIMPHIDTPPEYETNKKWIEELCIYGFENKLNIDYKNQCIKDKEKMLKRNVYNDMGEFLHVFEYQLTQEEITVYTKRYEYELDSLDRMGFLDYILLVYSYANIAARRGIARGSGGGSLINYLTNICDIDPIEHGLYFERFIDVGALDLLESGEITAKELKIPDIDLDFSGDCCNEVLRFLYNKYGEDKVASIGKFGTNQTKGTIRDMCKVLDVDLQTADEIAKAFDNYELDEIDNMLRNLIPSEPNAKDAIHYTKTYVELFDYVRKLNGLPKSFGLHACGKIVGTRDLDYFLPSCYDKEGVRYLQGDMHDVEDVGLVKIDVLGLRTLDQEFDTIEMSGETIEFINPKQSFTDKRVLDIFRNGDTVGIFQFASNGMKQTLKKMNVCCLDDISTANALFRPGSMQYIDNFCKRRSGVEEFEYLHNDLEPILKITYGIIVFQEQIIEIGRMAGLKNPDLLRQATAKKKPKLMDQVKPELDEKLKKRGWSQEQFDELWLNMLEFAKYSFNKSHSSAYAILAYMTAKQKAYYPAEFFAGLCNSYIGKSSFVKDNVQEIFEDIEKHNIPVKSFDFRQDHRRCSVENGYILYGIPLIRDCNQNLGNVLYDIRNNQYNSFYEIVHELMQKQITKNQISILIKLDFFTEFGNSHELLSLMTLYELLKFGEAKKISNDKAINSNIHDLIKLHSTNINKDGSESSGYTITNMKLLINDCEIKVKSENLEDISFKEKAKNQLKSLGFINLTTNKKDDLRKLIILDVFPLNNKDNGKTWAYRIATKSIGSGKSASLTVMNKLYNKMPISKTDIIYARSLDKNKQGYWYLIDYWKVG